VTLPATLALSWTAAQAFELGTVELIFDVGLHRVCTFTTQDEEEGTEHWGSPEPEVLQDYSLQVLHAAGEQHGMAHQVLGGDIESPRATPTSSTDQDDTPASNQADDGWITVAQVTGNYQRRVVHSLQLTGGRVIGLRVVCIRAAGIDEARICEIRAYPVG